MDIAANTERLDSPHWELLLDAAFRSRPDIALSHAARTRAMAAMTAMRGWEMETTWMSPWAIAASVFVMIGGVLAVAMHFGWIAPHVSGLNWALKSGLMSSPIGKTLLYAIGAGVIAIGAAWASTQQESA